MDVVGHTAEELGCIRHHSRHIDDLDFGRFKSRCGSEVVVKSCAGYRYSSLKNVGNLRGMLKAHPLILSLDLNGCILECYCCWKSIPRQGNASEVGDTRVICYV